MTWVVSVKGVLRDDHGRLLLGRNERAEWELIGGQMERGEQPEATLEREFLEESGLRVKVGRLLDAYVFEPVPDRAVLILAYGCRLVDGDLAISSEHSEIAFHDWPLVPDLPVPSGYRRVAAMW